jgi:vacuolar-type H+-ATPase subunit I/STV1
MADETTNADQAAEPKGADATETPSDLVSDLSKVDPKALQSAVDKAVQQALRTREQKLRAEQKAAEEQAERKRLEEAGEFAKLRERLTAEVETLRAESRAKDARNALNAAAIKAGLRDVADLALLPRDVLDGLAKDDGSVDSERVGAAVKALKDSKPYLFAEPESKPPARGHASPGDALPAGADMLNVSVEAMAAERNRALAEKKRAPQPRDSHLLASLLARAGR